MRSALKTEFKKLLTVRSTYVTLILALVYVAIMAFYVEGFWGGSGTPAGELTPTAYEVIIRSTVMGSWIFAVAVAVLFITHEYRYNIIMHTLTSINSRTKAMAAKFITIAVYSVVFSLITIGFALIAYRIGVAMRGGELAPQVIDWLPVLGQSVFYVFGYAMTALLIGFLTRNIAATFLIVLIGINIVESLLGLLLKANVIYLPYTALQQVLTGDSIGFEKSLTPMSAATVFLAYLVGGWVIGWLLFLRRDAN